MLSSLQIKPQYSGQIYCNSTQYRQLIALVQKLIHASHTIVNFIHSLCFASCVAHKLKRTAFRGLTTTLSLQGLPFNMTES